ncbi:hypothetical protein AB1K84_09665 [Mesobacillus foraminis]
MSSATAVLKERKAPASLKCQECKLCLCGKQAVPAERLLALKAGTQ